MFTPTVDSAVKQLTKALNQLAAVVDYRQHEREALQASLDHSKFELERAQRIHTKLTELLQ